MTKIEIIPRISPAIELQIVRKIIINNIERSSESILLIKRIVISRAVSGISPRIKLAIASLLFMKSGSYTDL